MRITYDFPGKVAGLDAATAELKRLGRSIATAQDRGDRQAAAYLGRRSERCRRAIRQLRDADRVRHHITDWSTS